MSFWRRVFGGGTAGAASAAAPAPEAPDDVERERRLLAEDAERLSDELLARQLRYADRSWTPPAQGGERRADDGAGDAE